MEVMPEHVQLLLDVDPRIGIEAVVVKIKGYTAHTIRKEYAWMPGLDEIQIAVHVDVRALHRFGRGDIDIAGSGQAEH